MAHKLHVTLTIWKYRGKI